MASMSGQRRAATASYIEDMLAQLRSMGQQIDADFLVYLLEMALIEASDVAAGKATPPRHHTTVVQMPDKLSAEELASLYMEGELAR